MFDNLRDLSDRPAEAPKPVEVPMEEYRAPARGRFLGMTAGQRFVLSVMLFFAVMLLGTMCLLVTQKVVLV
jgi:hypothetical protein